MLSPIAAVVSGSALPAHWSGLALGALFYQGVVVTRQLPALVLAPHALPATEVPRPSAFLTPVFGTLCASWLLGEAITPALVLALVGVGIGLALLNRRRV